MYSVSPERVMVAYEKFHDGKMDDYIPTDADLEASFAKLPKVDK